MRPFRLLASMVAFGSLWGALEATLGGALANFPGHGWVMANIGFLIMAGALALYKRPGMQLGIGLVAASFKLLDVAIFHAPFLAKMIVNPMVAIALEALAFEVAAVLILRHRPRNLLAQAATGAVGMYLSFIGIVLTFVFLIGRGPQPMMSEPWGFALKNGSIGALLALAAVPLGSWLGRLFKGVEHRLGARSRLYYAGAGGMTLLCLAAAIWGTLALG